MVLDLMYKCCGSKQGLQSNTSALDKVFIRGELGTLYSFYPQEHQAAWFHASNASIHPLAALRTGPGGSGAFLWGFGGFFQGGFSPGSPNSPDWMRMQ